MLEPEVKANLKWYQEEAQFYNALRMALNTREQHYLKKEILRLSKQIDRGLPVLDFGSGTGNVAKYLEQAGLETVAMDISLEMLDENPAKNRVVAESQYLPFRNDRFGLITVYGVLHHLPKPTSAIQEICRVAAPHCVVFIPHELVAGWKPTLFTRLTSRIWWILWRVIHPEDLKSLLSYILFHRKRLRKLQADLKHIEAELQPDSVQELSAVLEEHSFKVQTTFYGRGVRMEAYR